MANLLWTLYTNNRDHTPKISSNFFMYNIVKNWSQALKFISIHCVSTAFMMEYFTWSSYILAYIIYIQQQTTTKHFSQIIGVGYMKPVLPFRSIKYNILAESTDAHFLPNNLSLSQFRPTSSPRISLVIYLFFLTAAVTCLCLTCSNHLSRFSLSYLQLELLVLTQG